MARRIHAFLAALGLVLALLLALSGAVLSVYPLGAALAPEVKATSGISVGALAGAVKKGLPEVESLKRLPSGAIVAGSYDASGMAVQDYVDAHTGAVLHPVPPRNPVYKLLRNFHRDFLIGNPGRMVTGTGAALLVLLVLSGIALLGVRMGGFGRLFARARGNWAHRTHTKLSRWIVLPLLLSSLTGAYMVLAEFSLVPLNNAQSQLYPASADGQPATTPDKLAGLNAVPLSQMRELTFPMSGDPTDVFTLKTTTDLRMIDQGTGAVLERVPLTFSERLYDLIYRLHTGKGLVWIGLILGLAALGVPVLAATGSVIWWKRRQATHRRIKGNVAPAQADVVLLVGSQGGSTWGFAQSLHQSLSRAGFKVHVGPMNAFSGHYPKAILVLFLAATYGNGTAPASASRFLARLAEMGAPPAWPYAVLGFGDRAFAQFCEFAKAVDAGLADHGAERAMAPGFINRQSSQGFASWGNDLGAALGVPLDVHHQIAQPQTRPFRLVARKVYGADPAAQTAVLNFEYAATRHPGLWDRLLGRDGKRPRFAPSDLLGVLPPKKPVPRYYSIASAASNTGLEICVRRQEGGICSTWLHDLPVGGQIDAFVRTNPDFALPPGRKPVILVSAGTGIAPFMGMIRANRAHRALELYWGGRGPGADFLYEDALARLLARGHLARLRVAFSRVDTQNAPRAHIQQRLFEDAPHLRDLLARGAGVMVCGGDAMARDVAAQFDLILEATGLSVAQMKARGSYLEDIF